METRITCKSIVQLGKSNFNHFAGVGVGTLTVTMDGPAKVDLSCNEVSNGYEVCYTPSVPGKYFVTVKHNGKSLKGSPFSVYVTGDNLSSGIRGVRSILHSKEEQRYVRFKIFEFRIRAEN